jgi:EmrB/QacA subfamily drug resistance transporter
VTAVAADTAAATKSKFPLLLTASLVSSLIMLDSNIVAVSLPAIGRSIGATFTGIQWVISAYVLTYAALLLAAGNFADLHGRKRAMLLGLAIFAVASLGVGLSASATLLNLARAAQGVGGAFLLTASLAIISHDFTGEARTKAFSFWGASLGIALAIGPILGGLITDTVGWRWVFLINPPLTAVLILATIKVVDESKDPDAKALDYGGIVTFSSGLAVLIWALIDGNDAGWGSISVLARLAVAAALFAGFVVVELRKPHPMVDFALFRRPTFVGSVAAMIGYGASAQVMIFFLPQYLQNAYGFAPMIAGLAMIPFALPMVIAPRVTSFLALRFSGRDLLVSGLGLTVIGNLAFWQVAKAHLHYPVFVACMLIAGCGAGLLNGQTVKVLGSAVPPERAGMASGLASTTRFIGILVAVAGLGAVLFNSVRSTFVGAATAAGLTPQAADAAAKRVTSGDLAGVLAGLPQAVRPALHAAGLMAFASGFAAAAAVAACVAAIAAALTFWLVRQVDTAPPAPGTAGPVHCAAIDCRSPL